MCMNESCSLQEAFGLKGDMKVVVEWFKEMFDGVLKEIENKEK